MALKIHCYYKFFDAESFNNCYNETNFSKKFLFLDMANGPPEFCVQDWILLATFKKYEKFTSSPTAGFEIVFNG